MSYSSKLVQGFSVPALKGAYSPREVLLRMLAGTELDFRLVNGSVVVIVKRGTREQASTDGARTLGPLRVEGANSRAVAGVNGSTDPTATEGTGSYTSSALTIGSKDAAIHEGYAAVGQRRYAAADAGTRTSRTSRR